MRRLLSLMVASALLFSAACVAKPFTAIKPVAAPSMDQAMRAAQQAATATDWVPKTISPQTGYLLAEREVRVSGRKNRADAYRLEVMIPPDGKGSATVKVTPPPGVSGGKSTSSMVAQFLDAFEKALKP